MILDDRDDHLEDDHVDGLRRAGLPLRRPVVTGERGPSTQLEGLMSAAWAGSGASSQLVELASSLLADSTREAYEQDRGDSAACVSDH